MNVVRNARWPLAALALAGALRAQSEFDTWTGYEVGSYPLAYYAHATASADMDGDGDVDVVTALGFNSGWITLAKNRGDGSFQQPAITALPKMSEGLDLADVDQDGDVDVVASQGGTNGDGTTLALLRNLGDGSFAAPIQLPVGKPGPTGVVLDDFNGDGWVDAAAAIYGLIGLGEHVSILLNDGAGGFLPPVALLIPTAPSSSTGPFRLASGDLNGDGDVDLVAACDSDRLVVLANQGSGTFVAGPMVAAFQGTPVNLGIHADVALADADHDGDLDVFYGCTNSGWWGQTDFGAVILLRNTGGGTLGAPQAIQLPQYANGPSSLEAGDFDGDGWVDLFTVNGSSGGCIYVAGDGQGGFEAGLELPGGEYPKDVSLADASGDGRLDALVVNRHSLDVTVHAFGDGPVSGFHVPQGYAVEPLSGSMDAADMDGDADLDVATCWQYAGGGGVSVLRGLGDGSFAPQVHYAGPRAAMDVKFRDLDEDGDPDLLWATGDTGPPYDFHYRLNNGTGAFGPAVTVPVHTCGNGGIEAADMDHDGDLDVFLTEELGCAGGGLNNNVWVSRNLGGATFAPPYPVDFLLAPGFVKAGDLDGDGHMDLVVSQSELLGVRLGNGDGTFEAPLYSQSPWGLTDAFLGDLDGDGKLDAATCAMAGDPQQVAAVHIGRGDGTFKPPVSYLISNSPEFSGPVAIQGGDVDGDGDLDLMVANWGSHDVSYLRNKGNGTYDPQIKFGIGETPADLAWGDFDGDQLGDLAGLVHVGQYALDRGVRVVRGTGAAGPAWLPIGTGVAGLAGVPLLNGLGTLDAGTSFSVRLSDAAPAAPAVLVAGSAVATQPFKGGVLIPEPDVLVALATGADGGFLLSLPTPTGLGGLDLWLQAWVSDTVALSNWSASNGLAASFP